MAVVRLDERASSKLMDNFLPQNRAFYGIRCSVELCQVFVHDSRTLDWQNYLMNHINAFLFEHVFNEHERATAAAASAIVATSINKQRKTR